MRETRRRANISARVVGAGNIDIAAHRRPLRAPVLKSALCQAGDISWAELRRLSGDNQLCRPEMSRAAGALGVMKGKGIGIV